MDKDKSMIPSQASHLEGDLSNGAQWDPMRNIVVMYGCPMDYPQTIPSPNTPPQYPWNITPPAQDREKVQEIVMRISEHSRQLGILDGLTMSEDSQLNVSYFRGKGLALLHVSAGEDIATGIVELIRSYHETEIERLKEQLKTV